MRKKFVNTSNVRAFLTAMGALKDRGANEACLMVVDGEPGLGKTHALNWFATQKQCIYLRAKKEWTPCWMLREMLSAMNMPPENSFEKMFRQALSGLRAMANAAQQNDEDFAVIIDEVDYISRSEKLLETVRDLSDFLEIPFVFVGMGKVRQNITRFPQIASRVGQYVTFHKTSLEDVKRLVDELCEVKVSDELVGFLHNASGGLVRELKEGIANIERFGRKNPPKANGLTLTEMSGQVLLNDRRTGKPIVVRA